ncbi:MAG: T9SS type B sorting domain-containing protein [Chitinophagaceae bacterium]
MLRVLDPPSMSCNVTFFRNILFIISLFPVTVAAQLCTGSLGDPVVNIPFGSGTNTSGFSAPGYTYTTSTCPNDGYYTIVSSTSECFNGSWHTVTGDHTGGGYFMLVNASNNPGDFFVTRITGLCPNTTYEFSAWVLNVLHRTAGDGIMPNITFRIETFSGAVLGSYNSGDIPQTPAPVWNQYGFYFTTSAGNTDVIIRMTNNAPGGIGNDLALDDITFRPCGPSLNSYITSGTSDHIDVCEMNQEIYDFDATLSQGFLLPVFQWQVSTDSGKTWNDIPGQTHLKYQRKPGAAGDYWYRLTVAEAGGGSIPGCRIASNILKINVHPKPAVNAGPDRIVVKGNSITLQASVSGENPVYNWAPPIFLSSDTALHPALSPLYDISYLLTAVSSFGCGNEDQVNIKVVNGIFVPTAFTPNNDGRNDTWRIPYLDVSLGPDVKVFNRSGQLVYHVTGAEVNWDGTIRGVLQPAGVYVYEIRFKEGTKDMKGTVTLIR